jgi:hypothetical protein
MATKKKATSKKSKIRELPKKKELTVQQEKAVKGGFGLNFTKIEM